MSNNFNILILNGPNLNKLGTRQPEIYGSETLDDIEKKCLKLAQTLNFELQFFQSNNEGDLITQIQNAKENYDGIIINAAAYTHTSIALLDALTLFEKPVIEVHLSNIHQREAFRHTSYIAKIAVGSICGFGGNVYTLALNAMSGLLNKSL